jgi:hypothetical protein
MTSSSPVVGVSLIRSGEVRRPVTALDQAPAPDAVTDAEVYAEPGGWHGRSRRPVRGPRGSGETFREPLTKLIFM